MPLEYQKVVKLGHHCNAKIFCKMPKRKKIFIVLFPYLILICRICSVQIFKTLRLAFRKFNLSNFVNDLFKMAIAGLCVPKVCRADAAKNIILHLSAHQADHD